MPDNAESVNSSDSPFDYRLESLTIPDLTDSVLARHSLGWMSDATELSAIQPLVISVDQGSFTSASRLTYFPTVTVVQDGQSLRLSCLCGGGGGRLCNHEVQVLASIVRRRELRLFFDRQLRRDAIIPVAKEYGLETEPDLDAYFQVIYENKTVCIRPSRTDLLSITPASNESLQAQLIPQRLRRLPVVNEPVTRQKKIVVFAKHRYYDPFCLELFEAATARDGKPKNPLTPIQPLNLTAGTARLDELKFYSALAKFQNHHRTKQEDTDLETLRIIVSNPLRFSFFYHSSAISENITTHSLIPVVVQALNATLTLSVSQTGSFYTLSGTLLLDGVRYALHTLVLKYDYFVLLNDKLYLIDTPDKVRLIQFFCARGSSILVHQSKYNEFRQAVLTNLENRIPIDYAYLKPATPEQLTESGFNQERECILYLTDTEQYILITPVMKYGTVEVPVLSKRQIYSVDSQGKPFLVARDDAAEIQFTMAIINQHPDFADQLDLSEFYLHKKHFLDPHWFLDAFDDWQRQNIRILGFNKLRNNRLNPHKAKVSVVVNSGLDWFETSVGLSYGKQKVSLKHLHRALKNKSRFVTLDDGTQGVLPTEWLDRFAAFFQAGDIVDEHIRTPKINFSSITELYDNEQLAPDLRKQLAELKNTFANFRSIQPVAIPKELHASLRDYQKEGLNWLNFLDDMGFGGCLADDMGLGKTLQIIAFLLLLRTKRESATHLIVVPTSLLFNWQAELIKFAPSLKFHVRYGTTRKLRKDEFGQFDLILTSYGTLLSDIHFLKSYPFNYIILDESQAIKNPESQRYQAVRRLQAYNRIVLTGTPIENHTFDLYGQLSFACPGLLGSYTHFKGHYSTPIDKFDDRQRARQLQKKIDPFILRRTKAQVARELPEKTEMIIHCEMGPEQRSVYDAYEREFRNFLLSTQEGDIPRVRLHVLQGLTKLRQICNSPALLNDNEFYGDSSAKIDRLIEQIETKSPQHKILVFSQFVSMLDLIRAELDSRQIGFEYLTGQTSNRAACVSRFQSDSNVRVFLISLKAGGIGLNLTQADYVYIVDPWWNPAVENQAIDRSYRIGQTKNVVAIRLICPNTIEEKIMELQESKKELANNLIKTDESTLKSLTRADLLALLGP
ncbi:SNF2-related protein [Spirosoma sp. SC4-14]|uniref:DEAD/DEAH box helicase n=1 Tax=Spirosoma sp. SC4-14 TaxID=3128900 RepID=UPI0030D425C1